MADTYRPSQPFFLAFQTPAGELGVAVRIKKIRHIYLRISSPLAEVSVSAPLGTAQKRIKDFVLAKMSWILKKRAELLERAQEAAPAFADMEAHLV